MPALNLGTDSTPVGFLFKAYDRLFRVRPPQRRYKWTTTEVDQFWTDVVEAAGANEDLYFLGVLLLKPESETTVSVIDGQQRLTTTSLAIAILRDALETHATILEEDGDKPTADGLRARASTLQNFLVRTDKEGNPTGEAVLELGPWDNSEYSSWVGKAGSTTEGLTRAASSHRVEKAVRQLHLHLSETLEPLSAPDRTDWLRWFDDYLEDKLKFLVIEIEDEYQASLIFDTTNTRGLSLTVSERIKAALVGHSRHKPKEVEQFLKRWDEAGTLFENNGLPIDAMDDYIRALMIMESGELLDKSGVFKRAISLGCDGLRSLIAQSPKSYVRLWQPPATDPLADDLKDLLDRFNNKQSVPLLLATLSESIPQLAAVLKASTSLQVRNITIAGHRANQYQDDWPRWAKMVADKQTAAVLDEMRAALIDDQTFKTAFKTAIVKSPSQSFAILRQLENGPVAIKSASVDLEHIAPKALVEKKVAGGIINANQAKWLDVLGFPETPSVEDLAQLSDTIYRVGNQALLEKGKNRAAKDAPFAEKKPYYDGMDAVAWTKSLHLFSSWVLSGVAARQEQMAEKAPAAWPK